MSNTKSSLDERFAEIANAAAAEQQVKAIVALAKSPRLERSREERREAWAALVATGNAHLAELDRIAGAAKRVRKREAPPATVPTPQGEIASA